MLKFSINLSGKHVSTNVLQKLFWFLRKIWNIRLPNNYMFTKSLAAILNGLRKHEMSVSSWSTYSSSDSTIRNTRLRGREYKERQIEENELLTLWNAVLPIRCTAWERKTRVARNNKPVTTLLFFTWTTKRTSALSVRGIVWRQGQRL